jgi:long-chain acyl-CoA synthetase
MPEINIETDPGGRMSTGEQTLTTGSPYAERPWLRHYDYWVPPDVNYPEQPLYQILQLAAGRFGDRPATAFFGAELTFRETREQVDRLATALARRGITKGDRVGIMLPNCPQYLISFFAISRLGAIVTNINPIYTLREVDLVAQDAGLRALITLDALAPLALGVQPNSRLELIITTSLQEYTAQPAGAPAAPAGTLSLTQLLREVERIDLPRVAISPREDVAVLQYTGGTTGVPKGAMLTHYNLYSNMLQTALWADHLTEKGNERYLMVIPYFHIYGQTVGLLVGAWNGAMQIMIPKFDIDLLLGAIKQYRPTFFPSVPTLYISMLNHPQALASGLDRVRRYNSGSAPLPVDVLEKFESLSGTMLYEGYGLTEASPVTHSTPTLARRKPGSIGLPITGTECRIVDLETGEREVGLNEDGELCIRGPQIMKGYWNKPEETAYTLRDGWLYTGDIARMDEDGYFYIVQRKKDMIIVSGFNVYPNEVEDVIFMHPAVLEAAVIGVPDAYRGEAVKAFVVLKPGASAGAEEILEFCRQQLAKYKVPAAVEFVEALPKSAVGKVLRRSLRELEEKKSS